MATYILGISAFYHDSAACLVRDGEILAAAQEERFTRVKHDQSFPVNAVGYCLKEAGIEADKLDCVAFYDKPWLKFERILETYLAYAPKGFGSFIKAVPLWVKKKFWIKELISKELGYEGRMIFPEHHESHAASAFFPSPFEEAAFLTMDGVGEWATTSFGTGKGNRLKIDADINFPHSLGLLYSAFTYYTGFKVNSGEYKVMGLAPYGEPKYKDLILDNLMDVKDDGSFVMDMSYFNYCVGLTMTSSKFDKLFDGQPRKPESELTQRHMDLARSVQDVTEEVVLKMARHIRKETGMNNLCLAGGVALNCVANGKLLREKVFDDIWIQPASGDAGGALGAAMYAWHQYMDKPRELATVSGNPTDMMKGSYLGPSYSNDEVKALLNEDGIPYRELDDEALLKEVSDHLASEKVIGWFQGKMEFGPRALGGRSILGDPRSSRMQKTLNLKIKYRESFRPFAPSVLFEGVGDYFELETESPYMLIVADVLKGRRREMSQDEDALFGIDKLNIARSDIPAITHVDYSARVQTVHKERSPMYHRLLSRFDRDHGCGVLINTSFNVRGEPIVCTPRDAYLCFMRTEMDFLVLGNILLDKKDQPELKSGTDWREEFTLD